MKIKYSSVLICLLIAFASNNLFAVEESSEQVFQRGRLAYETGDYGLAREVFKPLAEDGHAKAQIYMGFLYDMGLGVEHDLQKAMYWFELSAEQGGVQLQHDLGVRYLLGKDVERSYKKAIYWWGKAAEAGFSQSQYNLALMYSEGSGIEVDQDKALALFRLAAEQGLPEAQHALGLLYSLGHSVPLDFNEAHRLFKLAAEQGYPSAQYNLGVLIENGKGTKADIKDAVYWYRKAADQGNEMAQERLELINEILNELDKKISAGISDDRPIERVEVAETVATGSATVYGQAWIKNQPASYYTIQINLSHEEDGLVRWLKTLQPLAPLAFYPQQMDGKVVYKAIYGSFADWKMAQKALRKLPVELKRLKPWLRRFSGIHSQM